MSTDKFVRSDDYYNVLTHLGWIRIGAVLAFFLESSEYLVVSCTSSITLSISGIFKVGHLVVQFWRLQKLEPSIYLDFRGFLKEICTIYLAVSWNNNKLHLMNTIGLVICLMGIAIHVFFKIKDQMALANGKKGEKELTPKD